MKKISFLLQGILLVFLFGACAKMGSLAGGEKDEIPPVILRSKPANYSINFNTQKIEIVFDEFIALKDINKQLVISPPLSKKPEVRVKNKTMLIDLKNELKENTTYTMNFGQGIEDNNEGNPLSNFEYVFSTGAYLDSLSIKGTLLNAFNLQPSKETFIIGIYDQTEDSIPLKDIPVYVGKNDENGMFQINNIKSDTFKVFALNDLNNNLIYDLPNEVIAFIDTVIILTPEFLSSLPKSYYENKIIKDDSLKKDLKNPLEASDIIKKGNRDTALNMVDGSYDDSLSNDSMTRKLVLPSLYLDMLYFQPEVNVQYMTNNNRLGRESFQLSFNLPLEKLPEIDVLDYNEEEKWFLAEKSIKNDTITFWITDTTLINSDTLKLQVAYPMTDSAGAIYTQTDTLKFIIRKPVEKTGKGKAAQEAPKPKMIVSSLKNSAIIDLNANIPFSINFPVQKINTSLVHLFAKEDSIETNQKFEIIQDNSISRKIYLKSNWKEKTSCRIMVLPGAFIDIYNHSNDTLPFIFTVREKSYYGLLKVTLSKVNTPVLVYLMNEKEQVLYTKSATEDGSVVFDFLPPAKYKLKFVGDANENKKWDTGNYFKKVQPENVMYFKGEINIRSNWDLEVKYNFGESGI